MKNTVLVILALAMLACGTVSAIATPDPAATATSQEIVEVGADVEIVTPPHVYWTVCAETLYVRGSPRTTSAPIRWLQRGEQVRVREWSRNGNGWAMIAPAEWVNGDYLCPP